MRGDVEGGSYSTASNEANITTYNVNDSLTEFKQSIQDYNVILQQMTQNRLSLWQVKCRGQERCRASTERIDGKFVETHMKEYSSAAQSRMSRNP